jgi:hypothetical protein
MVEWCGGTIDIFWNEPSQGVCFIVRLPIYKVITQALGDDDGN